MWKELVWHSGDVCVHPPKVTNWVEEAAGRQRIDEIGIQLRQVANWSELRDVLQCAKESDRATTKINPRSMHQRTALEPV